MGTERNPVPHRDEPLTEKGDLVSDTHHRFFEDIDNAITDYETDFLTLFIETVANQDYKLILTAPFRCSVTKITTQCSSGTCTLTGSIEGVDLGGDANSVSTSKQSQTHEETNIIEIGNDFKVTASSNAICLNMSATITLQRL